MYVEKERIDEGYSVADVFFNEENARRSLADRTEQERLDFFAEYERILLENAGLPVSLELARQVWKLVITVPKDFIAFDDTRPALEALKEKGYSLGVLSNLRREMGPVFAGMGLSQYLDFCINSEEVGAEKPFPQIFLAALERVSAAPEESLHVGDSYGSDVLGARGVGMHAVLIDPRRLADRRRRLREDWRPGRIGSLVGRRSRFADVEQQQPLAAARRFPPFLNANQEERSHAWRYTASRRRGGPSAGGPVVRLHLTLVLYRPGEGRKAGAEL